MHTRLRWPRRTVVSYWLSNSTPQIHVDTYPLWAPVWERIVAIHPHWDWWHRMWMRISPYYGDPFCYYYCCRWSLESHAVYSTQHEISWDQVPEKEREWMERTILEMKEDD